VPEKTQIISLIDRLALTELCQAERLEIAASLKQALSLTLVRQHSPPVVLT
jgi:hypothetical protein